MEGAQGDSVRAVGMVPEELLRAFQGKSQRSQLEPIHLTLRRKPRAATSSLRTMTRRLSTPCFTTSTALTTAITAIIRRMSRPFCWMSVSLPRVTSTSLLR